MNLILLILGRLYNINISSYTKTIQIMQYYYAINRASRSRPPRAVIVTPRTFRPCSLHAPRINTSHSTSQFTTSYFRTFALRSLHTPGENHVPRHYNIASHDQTTIPAIQSCCCHVGSIIVMPIVGQRTN